jgi:hypothetical protein
VSIDQPPGKVAIEEDVIQTDDHCPEITAWDASPTETGVFSFVDVSVTATDPDVGVVPGESLTFSWSGGLFEDPYASATRYRCQTGGIHVLTVMVSDNHSPYPCSTGVQLPVICVARWARPPAATGAPTSSTLPATP